MNPTETTHTDQPAAAALAAMAGPTHAEEAATENERRVDSAEAALMAHTTQHSDREPNIWNIEQTEQDLTDLLTNLRHFCDYARLNFDLCLRLSQDHHRAEVEEAQ